MKGNDYFIYSFKTRTIQSASIGVLLLRVWGLLLRV